MRHPLTVDLPTVWPLFTIQDQPANHTRCLGWSEHYFYPGTIQVDLGECSSGANSALISADCVLFWVDYGLNLVDAQAVRSSSLIRPPRPPPRCDFYRSIFG